MATYKAVRRPALEYASSIWCCCLPTPMILASGGVRSSCPWSNSHPIRAYVAAVEEMMCVVYVSVRKGV